MAARLPSLSFFFPAYNEEGNVEAVVADGLATLSKYTDDLEVIVVNDGSRDRTKEIADRLAAADPRVRVVHHPRNRGYGGAVRSGLLESRKEFTFFTDGDRQFKLEDFPKLLEKIDGTDAVIGYRLKRRDPWRRRFTAWVYNRLIRILFGSTIKDVDCAFKLFRRDVFTRVPLDRVRSNGAFFSAEMLLTLRRGGIRLEEVPIPHYPRTVGENTGASVKITLRAIRDLFRLRLRLWGLPV
ncbi:MAG TPA: glycosyltransferase family 2 protein [Candidatus Limnocylindrales bacterium]|nr:glycosyltransferase family 2 protein [Candidatus Limnocylindrales bacterium]